MFLIFFAFKKQMLLSLESVVKLVRAFWYRFRLLGVSAWQYSHFPGSFVIPAGCNTHCPAVTYSDSSASSVQSRELFFFTILNIHVPFHLLTTHNAREFSFLYKTSDFLLSSPIPDNGEDDNGAVTADTHFLADRCWCSAE